MGSNSRMGQKGRVSNEQLDEFKRRARRRLVGAVVLFLVAVLVVPALVNDKTNKRDVPVELVLPEKPDVEGNSAQETKESDSAKQSEATQQAVAEETSAAKPSGSSSAQSALKNSSAASAVGNPHNPSSNALTAPSKPAVDNKLEGDSKHKSEKTDKVEKSEKVEKSDKADKALKEKAEKLEKAEKASKASASDSTAVKSENKSSKSEKASAIPELQQDDPIAKFAQKSDKKNEKADHSPMWIQVAALSDSKRANNVRVGLESKGYPARVESAETAQGTVYRVRVGPFAGQDKADRMKEELSRMGFAGRVVR